MDFVRYAICLAQGVLYYLAQSTQRAQRRFVDCRAPITLLPTSSFVSPCIAWWRRSTMQQAAAPLRLYVILHHHALHGGDAVRCSKLQLHCVSTLHFITMHCMVETQYDAASCSSTASLRYTSLPTSKKHLHKSSKPTDYLIRFLRNNCA
jgi:hypothetical protein